MHTVHRRALAALAAAAALVVPASAPSATAKLEGAVLVGPKGADLIVSVPAGTTAVRKIIVEIHSADPTVRPRNRTVSFLDVPVEDGRAIVDLGAVARGSDVLFEARYGDWGTVRNGRTIAKLRPDLRVEAVHAPPQTLTTRRVDIVADLEETLEDTGATANLTLLAGGVPVAELEDVEIGAGGTASPVFEDVLLDLAARSTLTVRIEGAAPAEFAVDNNEGTTEIDVTEHELVRSNVLLDALGGFGAQFNQHVYAPISNVPPASLAGMESVAKELEPQLVRIFYNDNWEERMPTAPANLDSFYKTVKLAHEAGATINITYHTVATARATPVPSMTRFADVLQEVIARGYTNVRWVTIGNEPNSGSITLPEYENLHRILDAQLIARGLREQLRFMGGDLVEAGAAVGSNHRNWFRYMAENMNDILDAYSVHIYWRFHDEPRMEFRLKDVYSIVTGELPAEARKPTYLMEFAVRGRDPYPAQPTPRYAFYDDGTEMRKTTLAGFQTLWFSIWAAQLGYAGAAKWDAYWGLYDNSSVNNQSYWMTETPANGWAPLPTYHALRLLMQTTARGWQVVQVGPWEEDDWSLELAEGKEKEIAAFAGRDGELTLFGLDTHGSQLIGPSPESSRYSVGGLPPSTTFNLALWNAVGDGKNTVAGTVTTNAAGVARFDVPLHAAFSLTTVPIS